MLVNVEAERARQGMTKEATAKTLGVSQKSYVAYVKEERPIPSDTLIKMAQLFGKSTDYLLGLRDS